MADDVAITAGSGTSIATDDCTTGHVQLVKLAYGANGDRTQVPADADGLLVNLGANNDVTVTSGAITATLAAGTNTNEVVGDVAHDAAIAGNPVTVGARASAAAPTDVDADNDAVRLWALRSGALAVQPTMGGTLASAGNGTAATAQRVTLASDSTGQVTVTGTVTVGSHAVTNAGTFAVQNVSGGLTQGMVDETGSSAVDAAAVGGGTPHDSVNSGNPLYLGAEAIAHGTNPTAVAAADRTKLYANRAGIPFVIGGHPNVVTLKHTTITTAVTDAAIVTVGAGLKIVVTRITATLDNASTVFPTMVIGFGTTNTPTTTGVIVSHGGVPAGGGVNVGDGSGILGVGADNEDLRVTTTGNATGNGLQICVSYYTIES